MLKRLWISAGFLCPGVGSRLLHSSRRQCLKRLDVLGAPFDLVVALPKSPARPFYGS
jgi:hypothetical protein